MIKKIVSLFSLAAILIVMVGQALGTDVAPPLGILPAMREFHRLEFEEACQIYLPEKRRYLRFNPGVDWKTDIITEQPSSLINQAAKRDWYSNDQEFQYALEALDLYSELADGIRHIGGRSSMQPDYAEQIDAFLESRREDILRLKMFGAAVQASLEETAEMAKSFGAGLIDKLDECEKVFLDAVVHNLAVLSLLSPIETLDEVAIKQADFEDEGASTVVYSMGMDDVDVTVKILSPNAEISYSCVGQRFTTPWTMNISEALDHVRSLALAIEQAEVGPDWCLNSDLLGFRAVGYWSITYMNEGPIGLRMDDGAYTCAFFDGRILPLEDHGRQSKPTDDAKQFIDVFVNLRNAVAAESIDPPHFKTALLHLIDSAVAPLDPKGFLTPEFCLRLLETGYIESLVQPMSTRLNASVEKFKDVLAAARNGNARLTVLMPEGLRLTLEERLDLRLVTRDESVANKYLRSLDFFRPYAWRREGKNETSFIVSKRTPDKDAEAYSLFAVERFSGRHSQRPRGIPDKTELWHMKYGLLAWYDKDAGGIGCNRDAWELAAGCFFKESGAWLFPPHIEVSDENGDIALLALPDGVLPAPVFTATDKDARQRQKEEWFDKAAKTLSSPSELGLLFRSMFQYVSDSPVPEAPGLVGFADLLGDIHQTADETLERRRGGKLLGDCDDLAEFYQEITVRQGKTSRIFETPGHAVAGYFEPASDGQSRFVVLQSGIPTQFVAATPEQAIESAYRFFDLRNGLDAERTADGVGVMIRLRGEKTRRTFIVPVKIVLASDEYLQDFIRVQELRDEYLYSRALSLMEEVTIREGRTPENLGELAAIHWEMGNQRKAIELYEEIAMLAHDDPFERCRGFFNLMAAKMAAGEHESARTNFNRYRDELRSLVDGGNATTIGRLQAYTNKWVEYAATFDQSGDTWNLFSETMPQCVSKVELLSMGAAAALVTLYEAMRNDERAGTMDDDERKSLSSLQEFLQEAFSSQWLVAHYQLDGGISNCMALVGRYIAAAAPIDWNDMVSLRLPEIMSETLEERMATLLPKYLLSVPPAIADLPEFYLQYTAGLMSALLPQQRDLEGAGVLYELAAKAKGATPMTRIAVDIGQTVLAAVKGNITAFAAGFKEYAEHGYRPAWEGLIASLGEIVVSLDRNVFDAVLEEFADSNPTSRDYLMLAYHTLRSGANEQTLAICNAAHQAYPEDDKLANECAAIRGRVKDGGNHG